MGAELIVACPTALIKAQRFASGVYRHGEDGLEKRCKKCLEFWPADSEFFYANKNLADGLQEGCKACYVESRFPHGRNSKTLTDVPAAAAHIDV